jgi:hypothetical protein
VPGLSGRDPDEHVVNGPRLVSGWDTARCGGLRPALLVGGLSVVIALSLALLFALGTPWRGPITVSGQPIDTVIRDLNAGSFHP